MGRSVFVSYSRTDVAQVDMLSSDIENLGHQTWVDHELTGGQRWWDRILDSIEASDAFVLAVSQASLESRAATSEYDYARALGKPILPVLVRPDFGDSLMPPELAELQRVNYTEEPRRALAALSRALNELPAAPPLPDVRPERPAVPASYLFDLRTVIEASDAMSADSQDTVLAELNARLIDGHQPTDVRFLVRRMRRRDDVLVRIERELVALETRLDAAIGPEVGEDGAVVVPAAEHVPMSRAAPASMPAYSTPPPTMPLPTVHQSVAVSAAVSTAPAPEKSAIPGWWWVVAIVFGILGGVVAWVVNRGKDPVTARNMLIAGVVSNVIVWVMLAAGGA